MSEKACAGCGTANEADARFCEGCGSALERSCAACGTQASATARFCRSCGGSLDGSAPRPPPVGPTRKTVTVLFADLAGSTTFEEKVDAETAREVMGRYHTLLREVAEHHRVGVTKYIGDGFMAVWGVPEVSAGDAEHAVEAALELQDRFVDLSARVAETHGESLALRVAVNTGEVVVGSGDADLVGDALNVAARLESQCPLGHVVVGEETWRATRGRYRYEPLNPVQVKGRVAQVAVYQWAGHRSEPADSVPFVGRAHEIRRLHTVLEDAVARRAARLVTVIGDPGVGKTRLAAEFAASQQDAVVLQIRCAAEGTVALAPVVEVLRARDLETDLPADVPERDRILRDLNGMTGGVAGSVEETFWAMRRYFEVCAAHGRLILVLDDIHWADTLLLDFVEHLSEWVRDAPILMVALARPELRESRPELVTVGGWVGDAIRLGGLEPGATAELAARVLGSDQLPADLLARLPASTGGNPLFVRELVAMLVHDGVLVAQTNGWRLTIDVDAIAVPPTIQALLASRLERMNTADRRVLETASVIGTDFSPTAVSALSGTTPADVRGSLERLRRLELVQHSGAYTGDEPVWRFHHILIRDVAYRRLLKSDRAGLHERFADWIRDGSQNGVFESDELVARHLESAHGYRCELGFRDAHTADVALRSARCYLSVARRALDRDALVSAGAQAARGAALATSDIALRAELLLVGCEAFLSAGDVSAGASLVDELERVADDALAPWATCYRCQYLVYTDPSRLPEIDGRLQGAIDEFARRADHAGSAKAYRVRANARARLGRIGECEADLFEALIAARQGGDHRQITAALGAAPNAALWGPSPAPKAGGRCLDVVRMQRMTTAAPSLEATSLRCLAVLELLRGRPDKARSMLADAREIVSELGLRHGLMETELYAGIIESMVGDPVAAEPYFRTALEGLDSLGVGADAGQAAALLARSLLAQGRMDEADRYAAESERIAGHNLKTAIGWRAVRAEILSAQGRHREAVAMAREAVEVAADTDLVLDYADACMTLSRVLADTGDSRGAAEARSRGESLYAAKDAMFLVGAMSRPADPPPAAVPTAEPAGRLKVVNRACDVVLAGWQSLRLEYAERFVYQDRRNVSGEPLGTRDAFIAAAQRKHEQYPHLEAAPLAVRGDTLALIAMRWRDDAGNETTSVDLCEIDGSDKLVYHCRFDEDDFAGAYRVLEERYYAGEGKAFAAGGLAQLQFGAALLASDVEEARPLVQPDFVLNADPSTLKPAERSLEEMFRWGAERSAQVSSFQMWPAVLEWMSSEVCVFLLEMRGTGNDGEEYRWPRYAVTHVRDGLLASGREFDIADEEAAFAYAESLVGRERSRLVVRNRASEVADDAIKALRSKDSVGLAALYSDDLTYNDRRRLSGNTVANRSEYLRNMERIVEQYGHVEIRILAVRGERSVLLSGHFRDLAGNETEYLHIFEIDDHGLISYEGRFDGDDFLGAYVELERRYYAGEGAGFAESGRAAAGWVEGIGRRDIGMVRRFSTPEFRWFASASSLKAAERTVEDIFEWMRERGEQVSSQRHWCPGYRWLSPACAVGLVEVSALGLDGEPYEWTYHTVSQFRDGLATSIHEFDTEDEAFAYAESIVAVGPSRLAVANRGSAVNGRILAGMQVGDLDAAADRWADRFVYDDRRTLSGEPITTRAEMRDELERILHRYNNVQSRVLAVRGARISLAWHGWSDAKGNQSTSLTLAELGDDDRVIYQARFDEDDFESAYAELERRYYAGEGAEYAEAGTTLTELVIAGNRGDLDKIFEELFAPDIRIESRSRTIIPNRTARELRSSYQEFNAMVSWSRVWNAAVYWMSPSVAVVRQEREAVGLDGERYEWSRIYVGRGEGGRVTVYCEFDVEFEDEAFAYAEELSRVAVSRLAVRNRAAEVGERLARAISAGDLDPALAQFAGDCDYEDRRRLAGDPIVGRTARRAALERILRQYNRLDMKPLAVRGDRLVLERVCRADDSGNESAVLVLGEIGDDDRLVTYISFDEGDFDGAYAEMERRYYAGEGADAAAAGTTMAAFIAALNDGGMEEAFRLVDNPDLVIETRSHGVFPDRTTTELREDLEQLLSMTSSVRWNYSVVCWLSPNVCAARQDREATGEDGERYAWTDVYAVEFRGVVPVWVCRFTIEDEEQAFAAAEDRMQLSRSRLAVSNRASEVRLRVLAAVQQGDIDAAAGLYSDDLAYDDRRRLSGEPVAGRGGMREALGRLRDDYSRFGGEILAVRGTSLGLGSYDCSDDDGNQTAGLLLIEIDEVGRIIYEGRFDEDDFETAYCELERRYCVGEGAGFADFGMSMANYFAARNRGDLDALFNSLSSPDLRLESRSRSVFVVRSAAEHRASIEELTRLVGFTRDWVSAVQLISPTLGVCRYQREALGPQGEDYRWERIVVTEIHEGRLHYACDFDVDDEEAAFAFAEERARGAATRLAVTNRAAETLVALDRALSRGDAEAAVDAYREDYRRDDRWRLAGELLRGKSAMRAAVDRMLQQFNHFQWNTLAVRGEALVMGRTRWWDDSGNLSTYLVLVEIDGNGRIVYEGRFDEDDFDSAYRELDARFSAGEGIDFAVNLPMQAALFEGLNRLDPEMARAACLPSLRIISQPTTLASVERSFAEFYAWIAERAKQVPGIRHWMSVNHWLSTDCLVSRIEIRVIGPEGDEYTWPRIAVAELRAGRLAHIRQFEIDDEEAAFAYAEELLALQNSRLPLTNTASETAEAGAWAMKAGDIDTLVDLHADDYVFDDRRKLSGDALRGRAALRAALERILAQFSRFESGGLAVRGMRVALGWSRWSDAAGNQTDYLHVFETGDDGRIVYEGRFDEDDFEGAYEELERRYYSGEGAAFAVSGLASTVYMSAMNRGDFDRVFDELTDTEFRLENCSRSAFPDRTAAELRASLEQLYAMVGSVRSWFTSVRWMSNDTVLSRMERRAVGKDGEAFAWSRILVGTWKQGRLAALYDFDADDEDSAFACAERIVGSNDAQGCR